MTKKKPTPVATKPVSKQAKAQSSFDVEQPVEPIRFYANLKAEKEAKKLEREKLEMEQKYQGYSKKEAKALAVEELAQKRREDQIALNAQREKYGSRVPRSQPKR